MPTFTLGKQERLKSRKQLDAIFRTGQSFSVGVWRIYHRVAPADLQLATTQFGVGVSKKHFKRAVHRNRVKRLAREAWRLHHRSNLPAEPVLQVFFIYTGRQLPHFADTVEQYAKAFTRLQKIYHEPPASGA